jgi:tetratricopeptide (TPR) repeat protein
MRNAILLFTAVLLTAVPGMAGRAEASPEPTSPLWVEPARVAENSGDLARARGQFVEAASFYRKALHDNRNSSALYNKLGVVELKLNDRRMARDSFRRALKIDPQNTNALNNLGALSCLEKKYKDAVKYLKRSLALDESMAPAHLNMAEAWLGLKDLDKAMTEYARAIELDPDILDSSRNGIVAQVSTPEQRAQINFMIAKAYAKRGNIEAALEYLQRAKEGNCPGMTRVYRDQEFALLWPDPRLQKIVKR